MRLCIADPPYLGRAAVWYGEKMGASQMSPEHGGRANIRSVKPADFHPGAAEWDDPDTHRALVDRLAADYDGWAVAMAHDNLRHYLRWVPAECKIGIWIKPQNMPSGSRVINTWEPVVVYIPEGRRAAAGHTFFPKTHLTTGRLNNGFPGAKPRAWTRWVLDMLGYDQDADTVDDMFPGSGAVAAEVAQQVLRIG